MSRVLSECMKGYLAGIIDGEGTLTIDRAVKINEDIGYTVDIAISNTDLSIIEAVKDMIGAGNIVIVKYKSITRKDVYILRSSQLEVVYDLLIELKDYFISERKQRLAKLLIEFCESRLSKINKVDRSYSQREIEIWEEVHQLNKRGK